MSTPDEKVKKETVTEQPLKKDGKKEKETPYTDVPLWGVIAAISAILLFSVNGKTPVLAIFFPVVFIAAFLIKKRFKMNVIMEFVVVIATMVLIIVLRGGWKTIPKSFTVGPIVNLASFYAIVALGGVMLVGLLKMKTQFELYLFHLCTPIIVFLTSFYSQRDISMPTLVLFAIYGLSSIYYYLDLLLIANPKAKTRQPFNKLKTLPHVLALIIILLSAFFTAKYIRSQESRIVTAISQKIGMLPTFSFTNTSVLGTFEGMFLSNKVLVRIETEGNIMNLRAKVHNKYAHGRWETVSEREKIKSVPDTGGKKRFIISKEKKDGESLSTGTAYFMIAQNRVIGRPHGLRDVTLKTPSLSRDTLGNIESTSKFDSYDMTFSSVLGEQDPAILPPNEGDTKLPDGLREEFRKIALEITKDCKSDPERIIAIEQYLQKNFKYKTGIKLTEPGMDPVLEFVKFKRSAHCEYFASAMVLLLRSIDIPSRYTVGFIVHEYKPVGKYYVVREKDTHAWVQAWLPGKGWLEFDPTPPSGRPGFDDKPAKDDWIDFLRMKMKQFFDLLKSGDFSAFKKEVIKFFNTLKQSGLPWVIAVIVLIPLIVFRKKLLLKLAGIRKKKTEEKLKPTDSEPVIKMKTLLREFDEHLESIKIERPKSLTLTEFSESLEDALKGKSELSDKSDKAKKEDSKEKRLPGESEYPINSEESIFIKPKLQIPSDVEIPDEKLKLIQDFLKEYSLKRYGPDEATIESLKPLREILDQIKGEG